MAPAKAFIMGAAAAAFLAACGGSDPADPIGRESAAGIGVGALGGLNGRLAFWIGEQGPSGPAFSGPQQLPFLCRTLESGLGQPEVDNYDGVGHPVFEVEGDINSRLIGHSRNCSVKTRVAYFYYSGSNFLPFDPATGLATPPADLKTTLVDGKPVPFVVRVEGGTINRFMYTVAMLAPYPESTQSPKTLDKSAWNGKLVYWLRGGVGIGHQQSTAMWFNNGLYSDERLIMPKVLEQGFAVVSSTGNETGAHYNLELAAETALMMKAHFERTYGKPKFTIGLGISGGAVQQYVFAQNHPGLLDAGIPVESFPDMITQTIPASDCPLLGQYFLEAVQLDPASPWAKWSNQRWIQGSNASDTVRNAFFGTLGSTECINAWGTAVPTVLNPFYRHPGYATLSTSYGYAPGVFDSVKWTHWNDLANIYGTDAEGFAPIPIDNVGVQYGLGALLAGQIDADEFLRINACVGGWKEQRDFVPWGQGSDPFDASNMKRSASCRDPAGTPAPRRSGDLGAMGAAYTSGHVFTGERLGIPMIDLRPYLEPQLNIHNVRQSFSVRARLRTGNPAELNNQVIWFTGSNADLPDRIAEALHVLDEYLSSKRAPAAFVDKCVDAAGAPIASGADAWNGILDAKPAGLCTAAYPAYSSPRMVAGAPIEGNVFRCATKPLARALADGTYRSVTFTAPQRTWLERIFAEGVCDWSRGDQGRPPGPHRG